MATQPSRDDTTVHAHPSRRRRRRGTGTIAVLAAFALAAGACGGDDDAGSESTGTEDTTATSGTDSSTDGVTFDLDAEATIVTYSVLGDLDPHKERTSGDRVFWTPVYDTLLYNSTEGPKPGIATEWERSDDGLTWTFTLREGVTFQDGTPVDAAAVVASIERAKTLPESTVAADMEAVAAVEATGEYEVTITTDAYEPQMLALLSGPGGAILNPTSIANGNDFSDNPDGSGAYDVSSYVPATSAEYERVEGHEYWDPDGGRLAAFSIANVAEFDTALNGLQSGQYDAAWIVGAGDKVEAAVSANGDLVDEILSPSSVLSYYVSNQRAPFDDVRVRQALSYAIDRQGLADALFNGGADCQPVSNNFPYVGDPLYIEDYEPYTYDLDKAHELIDEAGIEPGKMVYSDIGSTNDTLLAEALQPMFEELGFDVEVRHGTNSAIEEYRADSIDGVVVTNARQLYPTMGLSRYWIDGGAYHSAGGEDDELKNLVAQLEDPQLGEEEIDAVFEAITHETARLMTIIPVCLITNHIVHSTDLVGFAESSAITTEPLNMRYVGVAAD